MSTAQKPTERVRAVVLSLLLVLSIVGGATAIAGHSVADDSLTDGVDETLNDTEDELDSETTSDDETPTPTPTPTADDSDTDDDTLSTDDGEELTDDVEETSDTDDVEDTSDTDAVEETTDTDLTGINAVGVADVSYAFGGFDWMLVPTAGTQSTTASSSESTSSGSNVGAEPAAVGITAGAANQAPIDSAGEGPVTLNFTETEAGAFPANGTAELSLANGSDVAFDTENSDAVATGDGATAEVTDVSATSVTIAVSSTDGNVTSTLHVDGLRFVSGDNATTTEATWTFGNTTGTTTVTPERLHVIGFGVDVARGADGGPDDGTGVLIEPADGTKTEGFIAEGQHVRVTIPEHLEDEVSFDESADIAVEADGGDCEIPILGTPVSQNYGIKDDQILIETNCEIGQDEHIIVKGVKFNVSGADPETSAEISAQLDSDYEPVDMVERVSVDAGDPVDAHAPVVATNATTVDVNTTNTTGDGAVTVSLSDDVGNLMGDGTRITVELEDTGVTFNDTQTFEAVTVDGDTPAPTVVSAGDSSIVLELEETSSAGDEFRLQRAGGEAIRFDVGSNASDAALHVTTTPGTDDVTQVAEEVVSVESGQSQCLSIPAAIDRNNDGHIGDFELLNATDHWRNDTEVPDTCGKTIGDFDLLDITDHWRNDTEVSSQ